jgi:phosphoenolpyruvate synthase/pyruvate phosphate dikinase
LSDRRNDASLFPVVYFESGCGEASAMHRSLGVSLKAMLNSFEGPVWSYYEVPGDWKRVGRELSEKVRGEPAFIAKAIKETYRLGEKLLELTGEIAKADLKAKSDAELWNYLEEYGVRLKEMRGWAWVAPALDASGVFTEMLEEILRRKLKPLGRESEVSVYFTALSNPKRRTLGRQQDLDLLKIAGEIKADKKAFELFTISRPEEIIRKLDGFPTLKKKLLAHEMKYGWLPCTYEGEAWDLKYFVSVVSGLLKDGTDPEADYGKIVGKEKKAEEERAKASSELRLTAEEARLFDTAADLIFFKADRKDIFFRSYYEMRPLVAEIAGRIGIPVSDARRMLPEEIKAALLEGKLDRGELKRRSEFYVALMEDATTSVLSGAAARKYIEENVEKETVGDVKELKGSCASPGYAQGAVRLILSPRDMHKMNTGDILVANATNPDVVPAMKKAAAIVTNTGGITCHAAIVSRELGIPCVVGTKVATEVLKDGEIVEVDATAGVVRKVN